MNIKFEILLDKVGLTILGHFLSNKFDLSFEISF